MRRHSRGDRISGIEVVLDLAMLYRWAANTRSRWKTNGHRGITTLAAGRFKEGTDLLMPAIESINYPMTLKWYTLLIQRVSASQGTVDVAPWSDASARSSLLDERDVVDPLGGSGTPLRP